MVQNVFFLKIVQGQVSAVLIQFDIGTLMSAL